jgi:sulfoxide reductase heme-binding subunit YedZ
VPHFPLHPTGEWSAWPLIVSLTATPLMLLSVGEIVGEPVRTRRCFGEAAFGYALLHVVFHVWTESLDRILAEATQLDMCAGWIAFPVFLPPAATSFDVAVRALGPRWKSLQRWVYPAAVAMLLHWAALHNWREPLSALVQFAPLAASSLCRVWWVWLHPRPRLPV